jgi:hypothetical protein
MNKFQYINVNFKRIKKEVAMGLISHYIIAHFTAYSRFDYYRKEGRSICDAALCVSEDLNISEHTVHMIKKEMESDI